MYQTGQRLGDDGESLQADVMRFMAIIAFCLIAILALVKEAEPGEAKSETPPARKSVDAGPVSQAEPPTQPALDVLPARPPNAESPIAVQTPPATPEPQPQPMDRETAHQAPETSPVSEPEPEPEPEEGLVLRFASDSDFLRLIAKGDIQVYAFQDTDVLTLNPSYRFLDTDSPGQVYELLPPSIPGLIIDALRQARPSPDAYRWGIALPGHISNQIERHLGQVNRGQLVIDRYGDVRHVAAS